MRALWLTTVSLGAVLVAMPALAQRAGEDALTNADDAFGTTIGNESSGLYGPSNARGFSPTQAGNVRIEGLYFDQQTNLNLNRIFAGSTIHVGISAQAYPFPAPTGIADYHLRMPGDTPIVSTLVSYGPYYTSDVEIDGQYPVIPDRLRIGMGVGVIRIDNDSDDKNVETGFGALARFTPNDTSDVTAFLGHEEDCHNAQQPVVYAAGDFLPPRYPLRQFFGQSWAKGSCIDTDFGTMGRFALSNGWIVRAGAFRSIETQPRNFSDILTVQPDGIGDHTMVAVPYQSFGSYSGEIRASKQYMDGPWRHRIDIVVRGRDVDRLYGGADTVDLGTGYESVRQILAEPNFVFGPLSHDHALQGTAGVAYDGLWQNVGELGLGIQKTFYHRSVEQPGLPLATTAATPFLFNAAASASLTKRLALFGSYTRGLEESGIAPNNAVNLGQAMPPSITQQEDAGVRYKIAPHLTLVADVFQVQKPYFNLNAANIFGPLGTVRYRGYEASLAGQLLPALTIVAGVVGIEPRVSGDAVDRGLVGRIPVGPEPRYDVVSLQYQPAAWHGFSIDGQLVNGSAQVSSIDDAVRVPAWTQFNLGARYVFKLYNWPASLRFQAANITNAYSWGVNSNGSFYVRSPRNYRLTLAADF